MVEAAPHRERGVRHAVAAAGEVPDEGEVQRLVEVAPQLVGESHPLDGAEEPGEVGPPAAALGGANPVPDLHVVVIEPLVLRPRHHEREEGAHLVPLDRCRRGAVLCFQLRHADPSALQQEAEEGSAHRRMHNKKPHPVRGGASVHRVPGKLCCWEEIMPAIT